MKIENCYNCIYLKKIQNVKRCINIYAGRIRKTDLPINLKCSFFEKIPSKTSNNLFKIMTFQTEPFVVPLAFYYIIFLVILILVYGS